MKYIWDKLCRLTKGNNAKRTNPTPTSKHRVRDPQDSNKYIKTYEKFKQNKYLYSK